MRFSFVYLGLFITKPGPREERRRGTLRRGFATYNTHRDDPTFKGVDVKLYGCQISSLGLVYTEKGKMSRRNKDRRQHHVQCTGYNESHLSSHRVVLTALSKTPHKHIPVRARRSRCRRQQPGVSMLYNSSGHKGEYSS